MQQQTIPVSSTPNVVIESIPGDLRVAGWERSEIMVKTDGDKLEISSATDPLVISCDEDLIMYVPRGAKLKVEKVSGDAILQALNGPVTLGPVAGDLTMNDLGPVSMDTISGDASLRNIGALNAETHKRRFHPARWTRRVRRGKGGRRRIDPRCGRHVDHRERGL